MVLCCETARWRLAAAGGAVVLAALVLPAVAVPAGAASPSTILVSVGRHGAPANSDSTDRPAISANGRFVAFATAATNLGVDTAGKVQVFLRDLKAGVTRLVSVAVSSGAGNGDSHNPSISADGRVVAFESDASNLTSAGSNGRQVFVRDTAAATTAMVSVSSQGTAGNGASTAPSMSASGRIVAFASSATNLVTGALGGFQGVFEHDRQTGTTTLVSVSSGGVPGNADSFAPSVSASGSMVAFTSLATNFSGQTTPGNEDVFVHDARSGATLLASADSVGHEITGGGYEPSLSPDGHSVVFTNSGFGTEGNGPEQVVVHALASGQNTAIKNPATGNCDVPAVSNRARLIVFQCGAEPFPTADEEIFGFTPGTGKVALISRSDSGRQAPSSASPVVSADSRVVAFTSEAAVLFGGTHAPTNVFERQLG